jgi:DNA polymerase
LLDKAVTEAGLERDEIYLTNTVKHFKHISTRESKRRIHAKPSPAEVRACLPWLESELKAVRPKLVVALGSTAAQALLGKDFRVTKERGKLIGWRQITALATVHPSSVLRSRERDEAYAAFLDDLRVVAAHHANTRA